MSSTVQSSSSAIPNFDYDRVDVLPQLPKNLKETIASSKIWHEGKETLDLLLQSLKENISSLVNYTDLIKDLAELLAKNKHRKIREAAAECLTQLAKGLQTNFGIYISIVAPVLFEKFQEEALRLPLIEAIDAVYSTTTIDSISSYVFDALVKGNPTVKTQTNQFLFRVFKSLNPHTVSKKVVKALFPLILECTGAADQKVRGASFAALGAIMKAIGKSSAVRLYTVLKKDRSKMAQIEKFYVEAVQESRQEDEEKANKLKAQEESKKTKMVEMIKQVNNVMDTYAGQSKMMDRAIDAYKALGRGFAPS